MTENQGNEQDLYTQVRAAIERNAPDEAVGLIDGMAQAEDKIKLLGQLARDLTRDLVHAQNMARERGRTLARARDLARDLGLPRDLARARDLDVALTHARVRGLAHPRDLVHALARDLALTHDLARERDPELADILADDLAQTVVITQVMDRTLIAMTGDVPLPESDVLRGLDYLTPTTLAEQVAPYLQAIFDLEAILADLQGRTFGPPRIRSLTQYSPISVHMDGAADAIHIIKENVVPWRRANAQNPALSDEQARFGLAMQILDVYSPGLPDDKRDHYARWLLVPLDMLLTSPLELTGPRTP